MLRREGGGLQGTRLPSKRGGLFSRPTGRGGAALKVANCGSWARAERGQQGWCSPRGLCQAAAPCSAVTHGSALRQKEDSPAPQGSGGDTAAPLLRHPEVNYSKWQSEGFGGEATCMQGRGEQKARTPRGLGCVWCTQRGGQRACWQCLRQTCM